MPDATVPAVRTAPLETLVRLADEAVRRSPADETSIAWIEGWRLQTGSRSRRSHRRPKTSKNLSVRIIDGNRLGTYRTAHGEASDLDRAIRHAMAVARGAPSNPRLPHLPRDETPLADLGPLADEAITDLGVDEARQRLRELAREHERIRLEWGETSVVVVSSEGLRRSARVTAVRAEVRAGGRPGFGYAQGISRSLDGLALPEIVERARRVHGTGDPSPAPDPPFPVVLSPEAVGVLVDVANRRALTARSYEEGDSFLRDYLGVQVFDRTFQLVDDGTDPTGAPFPFDLEGTAKRPVTLVESGIPRTPALDQVHAAVLGLPSTPHACSADDARAEHLFVGRGTASWEDLMAAGDGGLWIGSLDRIECYDPRRLQIRALAKGLRRIEGGELGDPVSDLVWDESLLHGLGQILALGTDRILVGDPSGSLGAIATPAIVLREGSGFRPPV